MTSLEKSQALNRFYVKLVSDIKSVASDQAKSLIGKQNQLTQIVYFCDRRPNEGD